MSETENLDLADLEQQEPAAPETETTAAAEAGDASDASDANDAGDANAPGGDDGQLPELVDGAMPARTAADLEAVFDIPVQVSAVLGKCRMQVSQLLRLGRGAVLELDRKVGEAIDIYVNNRLVARGEVVVVEERLGITMTEIIKGDRG